MKWVPKVKSVQLSIETTIFVHIGNEPMNTIVFVCIVRIGIHGVRNVVSCVQNLIFIFGLSEWLLDGRLKLWLLVQRVVIILHRSAFVHLFGFPFAVWIK